MKKKLVLVIAISVSVAPSVLFGAMRSAGEMNARSARAGSACGDTPALMKSLPEQSFSRSIEPQMPAAEQVNAATDQVAAPIYK
jgi:hypothetical protein